MFVEAENELPKWKDNNKTPFPAPYEGLPGPYTVNEDLNGRIAVWKGDITSLRIGAIVNAANTSLRGGGGVDGAIHRAAGRELLVECISLDGCQTGEAVVTKGYKLPCDYVIHTVGPVYSSYKDPKDAERLLTSCYVSSLDICVEKGIRSVAFCSLSTGVYGYPLQQATTVALSTVRDKLEQQGAMNKFDLVLFCVFSEQDELMYRRLLNTIFPTPETRGIPNTSSTAIAGEAGGVVGSSCASGKTSAVQCDSLGNTDTAVATGAVSSSNGVDSKSTSKN